LIDLFILIALWDPLELALELAETGKEDKPMS
jgi:hypothetical protein